MFPFPQYKSIMYILVFASVIFLYALYKYLNRNLDYWEKKKVPFIKPWPIVGGMAMAGSISASEGIHQVYNHFPDEPFCGVYFFTRPVLLVRDPEMIRIVTVKEFDSFLDHSDIFFKEELDPILGLLLFDLKGKDWKNMRSMLSPMFTGSKMRMMYNVVLECCNQMVNNQRKQVKPGQKIEVEMQDLCARFTSEIIAQCVFGIKSNAITEENSEFYRNGEKFVDFSVFRYLLTCTIPGILRLFNIGLIPKHVYAYFKKFVDESLREREKTKVFRPDMIHLLMQARQGELKEEVEEEDTEYSAAKDTRLYLKKLTSRITLTDDDILAQVLLFVVAGFETSSNALAFTIYEMALNPDMQKRLQKEIDEALEECNGSITYDKLRKMEYMDMVFSETLRKYPPGTSNDRLCTKDFVLRSGDKSVSIKKGTTIMIPVYGLHHDPKYFPDPEKYDPERFSEENRKNIRDYTYLPFSSGPRNCIGSRFGLMQIKAALFHLLSNFDITVSQNTQIPINFVKNPLRMMSEKGIQLNLQLRDHSFSQ